MGGKERRFLELLGGLKKHHDIGSFSVLTRKKIHHRKVYELNIPIYLIERKLAKKAPSLFYKFFKIVRKIKPDLINA